MSAQPECLDREEVWCEVRGAPAVGQGRPALFLDRDGVVVEEVNYLHRVEELRLVAGAAETIAAANALRIPVVLITNQGGIGLGKFGWSEFRTVQDALHEALGRRQAALDAVFACPYHPNGVGAYAHANHPARKPRPGMILRAAQALGLDLARSWIVGDKTVDLLAGQEAGLAGGLLVLTGHGIREREGAEALRSTRFAVRVADSIAGAAALFPRLAGMEG